MSVRALQHPHPRLRGMPPASLLFGRPAEAARSDHPQEPSCFRDLGLDQIVAAALAGHPDHDLRPFYYRPLARTGDVAFRQEVFQDLERPELSAAARRFAGGMASMRRHLAQAEATRHPRQRQRRVLGAIAAYTNAASGLAADLAALEPRARAWLVVREALADYTGSEWFRVLHRRVADLAEALAAIRYELLIRGSTVEVRAASDPGDYGAVIEADFARFGPASAGDPPFRHPDLAEVNWLEGEILDRVALLHPRPFAELEALAALEPSLPDPAIAALDRELHFYLAWLDYLRPLREAGLPFCYPQVEGTRGHLLVRDAFDLALAARLLAEGGVPVPNDVEVRPPERILVVSGPNQGGKTTFARMVGQLHYLASLGCPIPGTAARLALFDRLFTHFERAEAAADLRGKLEDDLVRLRPILDGATPASLVILNEIFTSTSFRDGRALCREVARRLLDRGALCVWVTFIDELGSMSEATVSLVAGVDAGQADRRTYRIERRPADGLAYALAVAARHGLTGARLAERLP